MRYMQIEIRDVFSQLIIAVCIVCELLLMRNHLSLAL